MKRVVVMFESVIMMGGLGLVIGSALALASKVFYVYVDPKVEAIDEVLPGANCGGCGFPGCTPNAEAIVEGKSGVDSCVAAGEDVAMAIAGIMGVSVSEKEPEIAAVDCHYSKDKTDIKYDYKGITDCRAANQLFGGMKHCKIGCLGLGTCVEACPFDAIEIGRDGLPRVDEEKCTACGSCVRACPKNIINLTSISRRILVEYTEDNCVTPCQRACPAGIDIREYIRLARIGDYEGSLKKILERNPFPTVISRICPAFCEFECRRTLVDEPVAINNLKRFVCDAHIRKKKRVQPYKAPASGKRVAVIGGGVEGLSAAYFCVRLGHDATVFDANSNPGGLLRYAFPSYRLPRKLVDWDINGIQEAGVSIKTGLKAGHEVTVPGLLKDGYNAVFTATGGWDSRVTRGAVKGVSNVFPGGYLLIDLLRLDVEKGQRIPCNRNVVIAGRGKNLPEAVSRLKGFGAENIAVVTRKDEETSFDDATADSLYGEDVAVIYDSGITGLFGEDGSLKAVEYTNLETGEVSTLKAGSIVIASGRFPELVFFDSEAVEEDEEELLEDHEAQITALKWEGREIYKSPADRTEIGFLSYEDMLSGYSAAISAINGGRRAAASIHRFMYGMQVTAPERPVTRQSLLQNVEELDKVKKVPRAIMPTLKKVEDSKEYYRGYSEEAAIKEAERCLRCGLVCYERTMAVDGEDVETSLS